MVPTELFSNLYRPNFYVLQQSYILSVKIRLAVAQNRRYKFSFFFFRLFSCFFKSKLSSIFFIVTFSWDGKRIFTGVNKYIYKMGIVHTTHMCKSRAYRTQFFQMRDSRCLPVHTNVVFYRERERETIRIHTDEMKQ